MERSEEIVEASTICGKHMEAAQTLLDAAHEYWHWRQRHGLHGAVIWLRDDNGRLLVFTRGEYADRIERTMREVDGFAAGPAWGTPLEPARTDELSGLDRIMFTRRRSLMYWLMALLLICVGEVIGVLAMVAMQSGV